jgi:hypothetical protein
MPLGRPSRTKMNLNNPTGCGDAGRVIDVLPQPISSVVRRLKSIGVPENKIWVYDVTNGWHNGQMPARLVNKVTALYPGVQFYSNGSGCSTTLGYSLTAKIRFNVLAGKPGVTDRRSAMCSQMRPTWSTFRS